MTLHLPPPTFSHSLLPSTLLAFYHNQHLNCRFPCIDHVFPPFLLVYIFLEAVLIDASHRHSSSLRRSSCDVYSGNLSTLWILPYSTFCIAFLIPNWGFFSEILPVLCWFMPISDVIPLSKSQIFNELWKYSQPFYVIRVWEPFITQMFFIFFWFSFFNFNFSLQSFFRFPVTSSHSKPEILSTLFVFLLATVLASFLHL